MLSNSDFTCLFIIKIFLEGEGNGGAREGGEEGWRGGVNLAIAASIAIDMAQSQWKDYL